MAINPLAIGGGVVAAAAVVGGGLYAGGVFSSSNKDTGTTVVPPTESEIRKAKWYSLSDETAYSTNGSDVQSDYSSKWGEKYSKYLIGVGSVRSNVTIKDNVATWTKKYAEFEKAKPKIGKFKDVAKATGDANSLTKVCSDAYKANTSDVTTDGGTNGDKFKESEIWSFCSLGGTKIKTVEENTNESSSYTVENSYGKDKKGVLVSVTDKDSDWFWDLKEKEFFGASANPADDTAGSEFKKLWDDKKQEYTEKKTTRFVKEKCKEAYSTAIATSETNETKFRKLGVGKFCTLDGKTIS